MCSESVTGVNPGRTLKSETCTGTCSRAATGLQQLLCTDGRSHGKSIRAHGSSTGHCGERCRTVWRDKSWTMKILCKCDWKKAGTSIGDVDRVINETSERRWRTADKRRATMISARTTTLGARDFQTTKHNRSVRVRARDVELQSGTRGEREHTRTLHWAMGRGDAPRDGWMFVCARTERERKKETEKILTTCVCVSARERVQFTRYRRTPRYENRSCWCDKNEIIFFWLFLRVPL